MLFEDGPKTGLLEIVVCRQGFSQAAFGHYGKGDTVRDQALSVLAANRSKPALYWRAGWATKASGSTGEELRKPAFRLRPLLSI